MLKFFLFLLNLCIVSNIVAIDQNGFLFKKELLRWNINYDSLEVNKAGALCYPFEEKIEALGFSYQTASLEYAKKIALEGCKKMKKKNKILSNCKCEIIFINNNFVGEEKVVK